MSRHNVQNLISVYQESNQDERAHGLIAYSNYRTRISDLALGCGLDPYNDPSHLSKAVGVFCALSPNNDERGNFRDMGTVIRAFFKGHDRGSVSVSSYGWSLAKAWEILEGKDAYVTLNGRKTQNFYLCIMDPEDRGPVVVDGHGYSAWAGTRYLMREVNITTRVYKEVADDYRHAASYVGLVPSQFQATLWFAWKRIHNVLPANIYGGQMRLELE